MGIVRCELSHPVFIILPDRCLSKAAQDYAGIPLPQTLAEVEQDFLSAPAVLALVEDKQPDALRVSFCTPRYELVCGLSQQQDAFFALRLAPLSLRTHNQIARGAVSLAPQTWGFFPDLADFNQQVQAQTLSTGVEALAATWKKARQLVPSSLPVGGAQDVSPAQQAFLGNVDTLIDLACQVELEKAAQQEIVVVKGLQPGSAANLFRFQLAVPAQFRVGDYLRTGAGDVDQAGPGHDGVVVEALGNSLLLRFRQPVELKQLQRVEWLARKASTRQYDIQHEAVMALRNGESLNQHLLALIVENRFQSFVPPAVSGGAGRPNPAQKTMIERALAVPDLLLALGPPGTGKTDTIREIVARQAAAGRKVLVTSKNNKAVDNVLEGLKDVQALRIGREEVIVPEVRSLLIDNRARALQQKVLSAVQPAREALEDVQMLWPRIQSVVDHLAQLGVDWRKALADEERERSDLTHWQMVSFARVEQALGRQLHHYQQVLARLEQTTARAQVLRARLDELRRLAQFPLVGGFFVLLAERFAAEWQEIARQHRETQQELRKARESARQVWESYRQYVSAGETALQLKRRVVQAEEVLEKVRLQVRQAAGDLTRLVRDFSGAPALMPEPGSPSALEASLQDWRGWYERMMLRKGLLAEWQGLVETRPQALYPALIRGADVIGATCIGIATDARFEDLEFDMVIADEAGQIQVMDLLVPLVRARRAILVGDHLQLPPVVEPELIEKIRVTEPENQELGEWLEKSLFERMIERPSTPAGNRVMLDTQYRMPRQIADFISGQFYGGHYHTGVEKPHTDAFFTGNPLVFIDTMREVRHYDQRAEDGQGYFNQTEARLIGDLVLAYQSRGVEPGVIVPYKKQAEVIRRELRRRQSGLSEEELMGRVATVDSFQGREQDVIIFGFTRSNPEGRIGFLTELRRLNVSLTRARRQLVLVGDSLTLTETADQEFARLMKSLLASVKKSPQGYFYANELSRRLQP